MIDRKYIVFISSDGNDQSVEKVYRVSDAVYKGAMEAAKDFGIEIKTPE